MDRAIFKQALHATARVACAAALVGCVRNPPADNSEAGTEDSSVDTGSLDTGGTDTGSTDTGGTDTGGTDTGGTDTGGTDTGGTDTGGTDTGSDEVQECLDELAGQVGTSPKDKDIQDCCETVAVDWEFNNAGEVRGMCCELLDWDAENFPGCTPWGPPRPPSMGMRLAAARKVRAVRAAALAGVA